MEGCAGYWMGRLSTINAFIACLGYPIVECFCGKVLKERESILPVTQVIEALTYVPSPRR